MTNIKMTLQYNGARYHGWQRPEKDGYDRTVSYRLKNILDRLTGESVVLYAGARTEPGVHALEQTVSFSSSAADPSVLQRELNRYLPMDIRILSCRTAPERFRADLNARSRTYEYRVCTSPVPDIFSSACEAHIYPQPEISSMETAAGYLMGRHDFRFFSAARKKKGTEKYLTGITFRQSDNSFSGTDTLIITLTADDFLYRMPLVIIGTLLEIGRGTKAPESIIRIMEGKEKAGAPCPAKGLLLKSIQY